MINLLPSSTTAIKKKYILVTPDDLKLRTEGFTMAVLLYARSLHGDMAVEVVKKQLMRSAVSVSLNYGESLGGESLKDFIHKMSIALKELRETSICLKMLRELATGPSDRPPPLLVKENEELIKIFYSSIRTSKRRIEQDKRNKWSK